MKSKHDYDIYKLPTTMPVTDEVRELMQSAVNNAVRCGRIIAFKEIIGKIETLESTLAFGIFKTILAQSVLGTLKTICLKFIAIEEDEDFKNL